MISILCWLIGHKTRKIYNVFGVEIKQTCKRCNKLLYNWIKSHHISRTITSTYQPDMNRGVEYYVK